MTEEQAALIRVFTEKLETLKTHYLRLKDENQRLTEQVRTLEDTCGRFQADFSELKEKHRMLMISKSFSGNDDERKEMKKKVGMMVREIDKCLELLNE
jgi:phage shock protein A